MPRLLHSSFFFFFNDTATTEIYTLSLHDALPIYARSDGEDLDADGVGRYQESGPQRVDVGTVAPGNETGRGAARRSEEHTSELQSHLNLVCRLLLEKKKKSNKIKINTRECIR